MERHSEADQILAAIRRMEGQIAAFGRRLAAVEALVARARLRRGDLPRLERLIPTWFDVLGTRIVPAREVVATPSPSLQWALAGLTVKALGRLLGRAENLQIVAGYAVRGDAGREDGCRLWRVERGFSGLETPTSASDRGSSVVG